MPEIRKKVTRFKTVKRKTGIIPKNKSNGGQNLTKTNLNEKAADAEADAPQAAVAEEIPAAEEQAIQADQPGQAGDGGSVETRRLKGKTFSKPKTGGVRKNSLIPNLSEQAPPQPQAAQPTVKKLTPMAGKKLTGTAMALKGKIVTQGKVPRTEPTATQTPKVGQIQAPVAKQAPQAPQAAAPAQTQAPEAPKAQTSEESAGFNPYQTIVAKNRPETQAASIPVAKIAELAQQKKPANRNAPYPGVALAPEQLYETNVTNELPRETVLRELGAAEVVSAEVETLADQIQNYLELCDSVAQSWVPQQIIDLAHVMIKSLNFDTISIVLIDPEKPDSFLPLGNRGYKISPDTEVITNWKYCVINGVINWVKLMETAENVSSSLAQWVVHEDLFNIGYAPIHDGERIHGFIFVGIRDRNKAKSPLASSILELCGGRMGLTLKPQATGSNENWPETVLNTAKDIRDQFTLLMGYMELLKESTTLDQNEIDSFTENCDLALSESLQLLDKMTMEAVEN